MLLLQPLALLLSTSLLASAISIPSFDDLDLHSLSIRSPLPRGGGGGRGGGGSSSSGSSGKGSGSGSSGSGGSSKSGSSSKGGSSSRGTSSSSNVGGTSSRGTGVAPAYGGRYAGGARVPYASGTRSPGGIVPGLLVGSALGFWVLGSLYYWGPYGAYQYRYPADITYYNQTSMMNETVPGTCLCRRYQACSCDAVTSNGSYVEALIGDGSYAYEQSHAGTYQVVQQDGQKTLAVNGTLANGTTAASGTSAAPGQGGLMEKATLLGLVAMIGSAVFML